ncbi:hypothetical protein BJY00DRAFT_324506 [Aspergillus carlsbadensis]|nr:hypothetical protein BJY00DRAFT_324506 [Aspergillus carlsbadensis]
MSAQRLQRSSTFEETSHGTILIRERDFRGRRLPEHQHPSLGSKPAHHRGHGLSPVRREADVFKDDQETEKVEDVAAGHRDLFRRFNSDPEAMANPYPHLERDSSVLKRDDKDQSTFLHEIAKMNSRGMKPHWEAGIYKIIPWVVTRDPDLLDQMDDSCALEYASKKCVKVVYCLLNLLLDARTEEMLRQECYGTACPVDPRHPLIVFLKETTSGETAAGCPHSLKSSLLGYHTILDAKLRKAAMNAEVNKPSIYHIIDSYCAHPNRDVVEKLIRLSGKDILSAPVGNKRQLLLHLATIVDVCPKALYGQERDHRTAYQQLLRYSAEQKTPTDGTGAQLRQTLIESIREACIGDTNGTHNEKLQFLYPPGMSESSIERKINLDLGQHRPIGRNYVNAIIEERFDKFRFETCLSYVCLPPRKHETSESGGRGETDFLDTCEPVFKFFEKKGVKKIFEITVNDLIGPFHSDRSIVELTRNETILEAAPDVKTVVLHSSGNYSTLQGWACKHGLVKLQKLRSVHVVIHKGPEDDASLHNYQAHFQTRLQRRFDKESRRVEVIVKLNDEILTKAADSRDHGREELAGRAKKKPIVKVALIDDGIDPEKTRFRVQEGRTFDEDGDTGLDHYYVDPGRHGTIMGRLISKMCPDNIDIISMSWTIPAKSSNPQDTESFQMAIADAVKQKKPVFCALRESEDALIAQGFYPVALGQVFRIGSATKTGNLVKTQSGDEKSVQFILPGLEVLLDNEEEIRTHNESYVATALAAGLAALILFCADLVDQNTATMNHSNIEGRGQTLRNIAKMTKVFETMSRESNQGKFPEVFQNRS